MPQIKIRSAFLLALTLFVVVLLINQNKKKPEPLPRPAASPFDFSKVEVKPNQLDDMVGQSVFTALQEYDWHSGVEGAPIIKAEAQFMIDENTKQPLAVDITLTIPNRKFPAADTTEARPGVETFQELIDYAARAAVKDLTEQSVVP